MLATLIIPEGVISDLAAEVQRAREKFPHAFNLNPALTEETGELIDALLSSALLTSAIGRLAKIQMHGSTRAEIRKEAIQVMAMAFRIIDEGDASLTLNDEAKQK